MSELNESMEQSARPKHHALVRILCDRARAMADANNAQDPEISDTADGADGRREIDSSGVRSTRRLEI